MSRRPRRRFEWATAGAQFTANAGSTAILELIPETEINSMENPTLTRIRGEVYANIDSASVGATADLYFGICVFPAISGVEIPTPFAQGNWNGWLAWWAMPLRQATALFVGNQDAVTSAARQLVDSRGRRRVSERDRIVLAVESVASGTQEDAIVGIGLRLLFQTS